MKRFGPAVLAPYGMPLNVFTPSTSVPRTRPNDVSASTKRGCARAPVQHGAVSTPPDNASRELRFRKSRRDGRNIVDPHSRFKRVRDLNSNRWNRVSLDRLLRGRVEPAGEIHEREQHGR